MNFWSNISVSLKDPEIIRINAFEEGLGKLPEKIYKIRELITRFEVCHFKYQEHIKKIKNSIRKLEPNAEPAKIGLNHIRNGENAWEKDISGKSLPGQQYVWALKDWLDDFHSEKIPEKYDKKSGQKVRECLGEKYEDKEWLVRLLLARLTWDWTSYEKFQRRDEFKELEFQICSMDICHYAFPTNLDKVLKGIGEMSPVEKFEGCGSYNKDIKKFIEKELFGLNDIFRSTEFKNKSNRIKVWLTACFIKTLKEQVNLTEPAIDFNV